MMMTPEERKAYSKGYNAGSRARWPEHKPPLPPDQIAAKIIRAARELRDQVDWEMAKFSEDDTVVVQLAKFIDAFDKAMVGLGKWIKES